MDAVTVDPDEIEKFSAMAEDWWDPDGKFKPLHKFNPVRLAYIKDALCYHFGRAPEQSKPLAGLTLLDIGCGGGLVAEPMARLGASVTAIDATEQNIKTALAHLSAQDLSIDYRHTSAEELIENGYGPFDAVLNLEVVEHVADVEAFLSASATLTKPGGLMVIATINRTLKALALAKIGAEYILRWLPAGTHDPRKFVTPAEIEAALNAASMIVSERTGVSFNPLTDKWSLTGDLAVNYMMTAIRDGGTS